MAITFGLDLSHYQSSTFNLGRARDEGCEFVFLKATEGANYTDPMFATRLGQARADGLLTAAYHYQSTDAAGLQSARIVRTVPRDVPVVIDVERGSGGIDITKAIISDLRASGYRVPLLYLPRWYWQQLGSPDLRGMPPLWSSRYPDTNPGAIGDEYGRVPTSYWDGYGGLGVAVLQFTSSAIIAGQQPIDANAYRGTRDQLAQLLGYASGGGSAPAAARTPIAVLED